MKKQLIIAIAREYGSGGHEIGKILAEKFGIAFYDRNILDHMFEGEEKTQEIMKQYEEKPFNPFLSRRVRGHTNSLEENLALMQFNFIKKKAKSGESFVIIGRCAESVLAHYKNAVKIFIRGNQKNKVHRVMKIYGLDEKEANNKIKRHDQSRARYHNKYSVEKWGDAKGYDICVNSSCLGIEKTANLLEDYVNMRKEIMEQS